MRKKKYLGYSAAVAALALGGIAIGQAAEASVYRYTVIGKTSSTYARGAQIGACQITTDGGTCTVSQGKTATRSIQLSLGASRAEVSGG